MSLASAVQAAPGVYQGFANVIAAVMLLIEFGMLRQALGRDQVRLYMAQSALISVLAVVIAADRNLPDLYVLAALSAALKVVAVPLMLRRVLGWTGGEGRDEEEPVGVAGSHTLSPASAVLAGIVLAAIGFFCFGAMQIHGMAGGPGGKSTAPATALSIAGAMVLVAFGLMIVRRGVPGHRVPGAGERHLAGGAGGGGRAAADPGDRVLVRPAGGDRGVRHADPGTPHKGGIAVHGRPDQAAGVAR
jgi:hydrogenase-4 membrane subunit HyfE